MKRLWIILACGLWSQPLLAAPSVSIDYRFEDAATQELTQGEASVDVTLGQAFTDSKMEKTLQVISLANLISKSLDDYEKASCFQPQSMCNLGPAGDLLPEGEICEPRMQVAAQLDNEVRSFKASLTGLTAEDKEIDAALLLAEKLASNMRDHATQLLVCPSYPEFEGAPTADAAASPSVGGALHVTVGGAQNYGFFKKVVEAGDVPTSLVVEGFMSEFDLTLAGEPCANLICVFPEVAVTGDRLFVQVGLSTQKQAADFQRKPLNLAIVLDISGSMSATDDTHQTRLEWAKDALVASVSQLDENDLLSIVLFDTESEILLRPTNVADKAKIFAMIERIQTKGSTNLESGLRDGYALVSENVQDSYENRVILISDAGLNTGVTDTSEILRLVTDNAAAKIGLTAIGMGSNFQEEFIHAISRSRGGNYIFVQTGDELSKFFGRFNYLVSPVAYAFKASLELQGIAGRLVRAYGIPQSEGAGVQELFDIQTLFFTQEGGGAIVLEYQIQKWDIEPTDPF